MRFVLLKSIIVKNKEFEYFDIYINLFNIECYHSLELVDRSKNILEEGVRVYLKSGIHHDLSISMIDFNDLLEKYFD